MSEKPVYRIAKWDEVFETSASRRYANLNWISVPLQRTSGYVSLIEEFADEAPGIYGAWIALAKIAAECPVRGLLCNSKGVGFTAGRLSVLSHFPGTVFERLIEFSLLEHVAWLEIVEPDEVQRLLLACQTGDEQSPNNNDCPPTALQDRTGPNPTEQNITQPDQTGPVDGRSSDGSMNFDFDWGDVCRGVDAFIRVSQCGPSKFPAETLAKVVCFDFLVGDGFAKGLAERLRSGQVSKMMNYAIKAMKNYCAEHALIWVDVDMQIEEHLKTIRAKAASAK